MRLAFRVAYVGTSYCGFQVQPSVPTIEGEIFRALKEPGIINNPKEAKYGAAGRTDSGVHATGQVVAFTTGRPELAIPRIINTRLNSIWFFAYCEVPESFNPRKDAIRREYRYILPGEYDLQLMKTASALFCGTHDFTNFSKPDNKDKKWNPVCYVESVNVIMERGFTFIDIAARSFLWHMVRKIAAALKLIGSGQRGIDWIAQMLGPSTFTESLEPAPAYGLILKNVEYENISWIEDEYAKKSIKKNLCSEYLRHSTMSEAMHEMTLI